MKYEKYLKKKEKRVLISTKIGEKYLELARSECIKKDITLRAFMEAAIILATKEKE